MSELKRTFSRSYASIKLMGGLGNQMFQVAMAYSYGRQHNKQPIFPIKTDETQTRKISYTDTVFKKLKFLTEPMHFILVKEDSFKYKPVQKILPNIYFFGYFQSWKYFHKYRDEIVKLFDFGNEDWIKEKYPEIYTSENSISVHIRRGDYMNFQHIYKILPLGYYKEAIKNANKNKKAQIFVFSDDIKWCKENLNIPEFQNCIFVEEEDYKCMQLMTKCKIHIIANSSFSWWGAYLSESKDVYCPCEWFAEEGPEMSFDDLYLEDWKIVMY